MSISSKQSARRLGDVVPQAFDGLQANHCRNPACQNFGVPPRRLDAEAPNPRDDKLGAYSMVSANGEAIIRCGACGRHSTLLSNSALSAEIRRLRNANAILAADSCPEETCLNRARSVHEYPSEYFAHGRTASGAERKQCKRRKSTLTLGNHQRSPRARSINKDIVKDLVNRGALNAILRKLRVAPTTVYDRIDFIHAQMVAFEAFKLKALRKPGWKRKRYALAFDAQDHMVNWSSRDRRIGIQLSTISTADNYTGFIFRTDVSFDPTIGDVVKHFDALVKEDFSVVENRGASHRYVLASFFRAVGRGLKLGKTKGISDARREELIATLEALYPEFDREEDDAADIPTTGALIKKGYTAAAHCKLIAEMLPADAQIHIMTDADGAFVGAIPVGYVAPLKERRADLTFVSFNKELTNPKKKALVAKYKKKLEEFIATEGDPADDAAAVRRAFIARYAVNIGRITMAVAADWWAVPIATMYEPDKRVAIAYQRNIGTEEEMENRRLELLDRASLHAVDSFFNVLRQRVSYFHRAGLSRSSTSFYNAFQPYRPEMVQKIVDIARIYFNWVEPRPFRLSRKFKGLMPKEFDSGHEEVATVHDENVRQSRREEFSTPAMRMFLAKGPVRLETILYTDWRKKLTSPANAKRTKRGSPRRETHGSGGVSAPDLSVPF